MFSLEMGEMAKSRKVSGYSRFFSEFSQEEENRALSFQEKSVKVAEKWKTMTASEKNKYQIESQPDEANKRSSSTENQNKSYICFKCGSSFKARYKLKYHLKFCGKSHKCECGIAFNTPHGLSKHRVFVHEKKKLYDCPQCGKGFTCRVDMEAHHNIHIGVRFTCEVCNKTFSNVSNQKKHKKKFH